MRGQAAKVGDERKSQNGYWYVKTEDRGWVLKHWLIKEKELGRRINSETEMVRFANGKRGDFTPSNIIIVEKGQSSLRKREAVLEARIADLQAELDDVRSQLKKQEG
jgi:hypothetical protein